MGEIVPVAKRVATLRQALEKSKAEYAKVLGPMVPADAFLRVVMTTCQTNPALLDCEQSSLLAGVMQSAQLGLSLDPLMGEAYLVPRRVKGRDIKRANFQLGYRGILKLMRRSREVADAYAYNVRKGDEFRFSLGTNREIVHVPVFGPPITPQDHLCSYAVVVLRDGTKCMEVMSAEEIQAIRARAEATGGAVWATDYGEMARKTPLRRVGKTAPVGDALARQMAAEEAVDAGVAAVEDLVGEIPPEAEAPKPGGMEALVDKMGGQS